MDEVLLSLAPPDGASLAELTVSDPSKRKVLLSSRLCPVLLDLNVLNPSPQGRPGPLRAHQS